MGLYSPLSCCSDARAKMHVQNHTGACPKLHAHKAMSACTHTHAEKYTRMRKPTCTHRHVHAQNCTCTCAQKRMHKNAHAGVHRNTGMPKKSHVHAKPPHMHAEKQARMPLKTGARTKSCMHMQKCMRLCPKKSARTHAQKSTCTKIHMHAQTPARTCQTAHACMHKPTRARIKTLSYACTALCLHPACEILKGNIGGGATYFGVADAVGGSRVVPSNGCGFAFGDAGRASRGGQSIPLRRSLWFN